MAKSTSRSSAAENAETPTVEETADARRDAPESEGWKRLGVAVREARNKIGYSNREDFAAACNISQRVLADLEAGKRSNFSERVLSLLESGLGWPDGTTDAIVSDPDFEPPKPADGKDLLFRIPTFDRRPVQLDVVTVEKTISLLSEIRREQGSHKVSATSAEAVSRIAQAAVVMCWPYVNRLVEDNCLPGLELHPSVRPIFEAFLEVHEQFAAPETASRYARWLAGDAEVSASVKRRYTERFNESRRARSPRRMQADDADYGDDE